MRNMIARCLLPFVLVSPLFGQTLRSQAVIDLQLDSNTEFADAASAGEHADVAVLRGSKPQLITSPFWNQKGRAIILDAARKHYIEVPDGPDTDQGKAVTVSTFFVNLTPPTDAGYRGLFAKRGPGTDSRTNYGINFQMSSDNFQVYIHDGPGFKVATYSAKQAIPFSKLLHLTTTWEVADAPGSDADKDVDDMVIRMYVNGKIIKPKASAAGFVSGNDAWLLNVDAGKMVNDVPLTIGSSFGDSELASGVYDDFLLFDKALPPADVQKLFVELVGETTDAIAKREQAEQKARAVKPVISQIMPRGLQMAGTTRVTLTGSSLQNSTVFPGRGVGTVKVVQNAANKIVADISVPKTTTPGFYSVRVHNAAGISEPVTVAVDRFTQSMLKQTSAKEPTELAGAFSGTIAGSQEQRVWFKGTQGQRVVADVESRRLGGAMEPVLEIKNARGTPLTIEWRKHELHGDTRATTVLPADGVYFIELHDLAYKAPGNTPFRIRVGDLKVVDRLMPSGTGNALSLAAVGSNVDNVSMKSRAGLTQTSLVIDTIPDLDGPLPPLTNTNTTEVSEAAGKLPVVDATFTGDNKNNVVAVNGITSKPREVDLIRLKVTEGTRLHFHLQSRSLGSPLDGSLRINNGKQVLGAKNSGGTGADSIFEVTVPKGVKTLQARVADFTKGGSPAHAYRLLVSRAGRADFKLAASRSAVEIPENGSAVLKLNLTRAGSGFAYSGPIKLSVEGDPGVRISPAELPEENGNRDIFAVLTRTAPTTDDITPISIIAESTRGPKIRKAVAVPTNSPVLTSQCGEQFAVGKSPAVTASLHVVGQAPVLFRGTEVTIPVHITSHDDKPLGAVRFKLLSSERARPKKPLVQLVPNQFLTDGQTKMDLRIVVPLDQVDPIIDGIIVGELVSNPFAASARASVYSAPIRFRAETAVAVAPEPASLSLKIGGEPSVTGKLTRRPGFAAPVRVSMAGLPKGYAATPVIVPADQDAFSISITLPKDAKPMAINAQLVVQTESGEALLPNQAVSLKTVK